MFDELTMLSVGNQPCHHYCTAATTTVLLLLYYYYYYYYCIHGHLHHKMAA